MVVWPQLLGIMHSLYSNPSAQVLIQVRYSKVFSIEKGTRQGCLLSPLIFAIAIETLTILDY